MKKTEIKVPEVGESITEADIESWQKETGDKVKKGDILALLETDKASLEIPAEQSGKLTIVKKAGETVAVGEVIGFLEEVKADSKETSNSLKNSKSEDRPKPQLNPSKTNQPASNNHIAKQQPSSSLTEEPNELQKNSPQMSDLSPAVRHLIGENKLTTEGLKGTGKDGRLTKEDILHALKDIPNARAQNTIQQHPTKPAENQKTTDAPASDQRREPMTRLRKTIASRLLQSQQTTATLSTFNEADMSQIIKMRQKYQELFIKKHGVKLGFMGFFVKATVFALKRYPKINAFIDDNDIIYNNSYHIGIAVSTPNGLVVPVIRQAEKMSLSDIERQIKSYGAKAKNRTLSLDDLSGGTFTISNGGVFGSLLSTPILNPPQSGILGMHKIENRPVVKDNQIQIRPMMYLTLSYDHRIVDGRESVQFLVTLKEIIEDPARLLIEV